MQVCKQNCYLDQKDKGSLKCEFVQVLPNKRVSLSFGCCSRATAVYNISSYLTSCFQEVCDLRHGHKVSHMGLACSCCPPVNFKFPLLQYLLQLLFPENLLQWKQKSCFNGSVPPHSTNNLRYADYTTLTAEGKEELKNLLMKEKESEKAGLKLNIQKTKIMASGPTTSWQIDGGKNANSDRLCFLGLQNHCSDCSHEIKRCSLEEKL